MSPDKRLVWGYVKQSEVHNRILEEERCWREYRNRKREKIKNYLRRSSKSPLPVSRSDSAEREWRRERKRQLEETRKITASAACPTTALDFWRQVVRCNGDIEGRWGHDGFEELENPGPPASLSIDKRSRLLVSSPKSPTSKVPSVPITPHVSSSSTSSVSEKKRKRRKKRRMVKKKEKIKKKAREKRKSSTSSSDDTDDVEWVEKTLVFTS